MKNTKFNIIIPTRTRHETLYHTIKTALNQDYDNLEVIVSDNFSEDLTHEVVSSFNDKRLKYYNTESRLSMAGNFEFAFSKVTDGFVMYLGDDDGILPNVLGNLNELINEYKVSAVTSFPAAYTWPDFHDTERANLLSWGGRKNIEIRKTSDYLREFFTFRPGYTFDLPGAYCGFVDKIVLEKARSKDGILFHSQVPDAYSAFAVSMFIEEYLYSYKPFTIHGASSRSNGASHFSANKGVESKNFDKENTIDFHTKVVACPSFRVIALETYLQLIDVFPEFNKIRIDWDAFLKAAYKERQSYNEEMFDIAFKEMCLMHGVDFKSLTNKSNFKLTNLSKIISFAKMLFSPYKLELVDQLGIRNVYDASIALSILINQDRKVISRADEILGNFRK